MKAAPKRIITTAAIGYLPYLEYTRPHMLEYASKTGADFMEVRWFPELKEYNDCCYYVCVEILKRFAAQDYYDELLFLDADVLILPDSPDVFELTDGMAMAADWYLPTQTGHFEHWLREHAGGLELFEPEAPYFNSGVIVIHRDVAKELIFEGPYPAVPWYDQDWINFQVRRAGIKVDQLCKEWNYRELGDPSVALQEAHFLHFCGDARAKARVEEYCRLFEEPSESSNPSSLASRHLLEEHSLLNPAYWISQIVPREEAFVVQIGSNDGKTGDPLYNLLQDRKEWKALFVEPVRFLFDRLRKNYPDAERFLFENSVVNDGCEATFYWVNERAKQSNPDFPPWHDQLGGFNRTHIIDHIPELEPFIEETKVEGLTLDQLLTKHDVSAVDILHIDAEGSDYMILSQLDLKRFKPSIILFEKKHLSEAEKRASIGFLEKSYELYDFGADTFGVRKDYVVPRDMLKPLSDYRMLC